MGISLADALRCPLRIDPQQSQPDKNDPLLQSMDDLVFFEAWLSQPPDKANRLLLLAPFGSGKSVMLAKFALIMAYKLKEWCELPDRTSLPLVPFAVRLRGWGGNGRAWDFMRDEAQKDVLGWHVLTAEQIQTLRNLGALLPLLDGFDELPETPFLSRHEGKDARRQLIDEMLASPSFENRLVLASRPEHGAERSQYVELATIRTLGELDQPKAEMFIRERLRHLEPSALEERLERYRATRPAINDLFRRPLFLAAWCSKASLPGAAQNIPTTISDLMSVMMNEVLDARLADYAVDSSRHASLEELRKNRHLLGALLAMHVEVGFAVPVLDSIDARHSSPHWNAFADDALYERFERSAAKIGLLVRGAEGTYTHKIPTVEYLIGCYYAWLAEPKSQTDLERPRQLVRLFQKRFWWPDHEEIWLYAFDQMWHGSEPQWKWAGELVEWVLNLSDACVKNANWDGPLPEEQTVSDREPYSCDVFALRVLLPIDEITSPANHHAEELIERAEKQLKARWDQVWRFLKGGVGPTLVRLAQRRPRIVWETLLDFLSNSKYELHWVQISGDIESTVRYWDNSAIDQLLKCVLVSKSKQGLMYRCILNVLQWHDYIDQLLEYLAKPEYVDSWGDIAYAIYYFSTDIQISQTGISRLFEYLTKPEYKPSWEYIALTINRKNFAPVSSAAVESLFGCLAKPEYSDAWGEIARIIGKSSLEGGPSVMDRLTECLIDANYKDAWWSIRFGIDEASAQVGPPVVDRLLDYLAKPECEHAWSAIAFSISDVCPRFGSTAAVDRLVGFLARPEYMNSWEGITEAIRKAHRHVGPTSADRLRQFLEKPEYKRVWKAIGDSLKFTFSPASNAALDKLLDYLTKQEYEDLWADMSSLIGRASAEIGPAAMNRLLECQEIPEYKPARLAIARAIRSATAWGGSVDLDRLLEYVAESEYAGVWKEILRAIGKASSQIGPAAFDRLLGFLAKPTHAEAWAEILDVIGETSAQIDSAAQVRLLEHLADPIYKKVWPKLASMIAKASEKIAPATADVLFEYLAKPEYEGIWHTLTEILGRLPPNDNLVRQIREFARSGRISTAIRLMSVTTDLVWFVRDVNPAAKAGPKIFYDVAKREDAELLLPTRNGIAPEIVRRLLSSEPPEDAKPASGQDPLRSQDVFNRIEAALVRHRSRLKEDAAALFAKHLKQLEPEQRKSSRHRFFFRMLVLLRRHVPAELRPSFIWRKSPNGRPALIHFREMLEVAAGKKNTASHGGGQTRVNGTILDDVLLHANPELLNNIVAQVKIDGVVTESWKDYDLAAFPCWHCGCVYPVPFETYSNCASDELPAPPKHGCVVCNAKLDKVYEAINALRCQSDEDRFVLESPRNGEQWPFRQRRSTKHCPCPDCRACAKELMPVELIFPNRKSSAASSN